MKKKVLIFSGILLLILVVLLTMYLIDKNKMKNGEPVVFSTWGAKYAPIENEISENESAETDTVILTSGNSNSIVQKTEVNDSSENISSSIMTVTNSVNGVSSPSEYIFNNNTYTTITEPYIPSNSVIQTPDGAATIPSPVNPDITVTNPSEPVKIKRDFNKVSMEIKDGTLTKTGATIVITDRNENPYGYGTWFRIDKKVDGGWKKLDTIREDVAFNAIAMIPNEDGILQTKEDWTNIYGELEPGEYRMVKDVYENGSKYIYAEFSIEE